VARPNLLLLHVLFGSRQLADSDHERFIDTDPVEQLQVGPKRICNDQRVTPVVLRAGNCMPVAKSIHLFWVQRVNCEPTFNERFD
jgi:hypothetical protein